MLSLSSGEAGTWCAAHHVAAGGRGPEVPAGRVTLPIPVDSGARVALVSRQMQPFAAEQETLVWFTGWGIWPSSERPHIFDRFRASYGVTRPLAEVPAHTFTPSEFEDLVSFVTLGVMFLWDVNVVGASGERMLAYSHDEMVDVVA